MPVIEEEQEGEIAIAETVSAPVGEAEGSARDRVLRPVQLIATLPGQSRGLKERLV